MQKSLGENIQSVIDVLLRNERHMSDDQLLDLIGLLQMRAEGRGYSVTFEVSRIALPTG